MKELRAILLEDADMKDKESMTDEAFNVCISADIVVFHGRIVKNRHGDIDTSNVQLRGAPKARPSDQRERT